ncbi:cytochrome P450 [Mycena floridula]|nr:cytochrome P450 [Mycena floridula]
MDVFTGARLINRFPDFLKPLVAHFFTNTHAKIKEGMQYALLTALYNVATRPELTSIGKMRKLDSVIKESQRVVASALAVRRTALKNFTFSDGTVVPAGCSVAAAQAAIHCDDENYEDGKIFKPLRFAEMRDSEGEGLKHQMTTPTPTFLAFGAGRHAWPGRFFAALELKATLAHLLMAYDLKMPDGHPSIMPVIRGHICANPTGHVFGLRKQTQN